MIVRVPAELGVYVTEQLEVPMGFAPWTKVHGFVKKLPLPLLLKLTVPVGVTTVPELVSWTVATQAVAPLVTSGFGPHATLVVVARTAESAVEFELPGSGAAPVSGV